MNVVWTTGADVDREELLENIVENNPAAADEFDELIDSTIWHLACFPSMGKLGRVTGTREFVAHQRYRIVYSVEVDSITVLAVEHTSRQSRPIYST